MAAEAEAEVIPSPPGYKGADAIAPPPKAETIPSPPGYVAPAPRGEGDKVIRPSTPEDVAMRWVNAGQPNPLDPVQQVGNVVAPIALTTPLIAAGGEALPMAPWAGRLAAQAGLSTARGEDLLHTAIDVGGAGLGEVAGAIGGKVLGAVAGPASRAAARDVEVGRLGREARRILPQLDAETDVALFGAARKNTAKVLEGVMAAPLASIKQRLGPVVRFDVPSLGTGRVSLEEAIDGMWKASKETRPQVRAEIIAKLNALDPQGVAGKMFDEALQARAAARTYLGVVDKALDADGKYDPRRAAQYINKNYDKLQRYSGKYWPQLEGVFLRGEKAPVPLPAKAEPMHVLGRRIEAPMWASQIARHAERPLTSPTTQSVVDTALGTPPFGAVALGATEGLAKPVLRHVPGGREVGEVIEEAAAE